LYRSIGAFAYLFDISPIYSRAPPLFYNVQDLAFENWVNNNSYDFINDYYGAKPIGQHYFQSGKQTGTDGVAPVWDFTEAYGPTAMAYAEVVGDLPSPDSDPGSVDWQQLTVTAGVLAQDILRVYTNGGEPPNQVSVFLSVMCTARLNAFFSVCLDQ
jgi:hypothetical protein